MEDYNDFINKFLNDLETNLVCEMEVSNLNLKAKEDLIYKKPVQLN